MALGAAPLVTLLIPDRQEPQCWQTVWRLETELRDLPIRIVVESDPTSSGIGATLRRGLQRVSTLWVIFVMADGSEDPACLRKMIDLIQEGTCPAVWGTRWSPRGQTTGYPWVKRLCNRLGNQWIAWRMDTTYSDWTDVAKAYQTATLRRLTWDDDFRCAIQIPLRVWRRVSVRRIGIVPMHWTERTAGRSAYSWRQALRCLRAAWIETRKG